MVLSILGILLCGLLGGSAGWAAMQALGLQGTTAAILAAIIGMVVATAAWIGLTTLLRKAGWLR